MEDRLYPILLAEIERWRRCHSTSLDEARKRFVQFVVLDCIGASVLRGMLAFKGGNALRFIHRSPRSTVDLDFTADSGFPNDSEQIRSLLDAALAPAAVRFDLKARCQRIRPNPPGRDKTFPTYDISVAYQLPGDRHFPDFESWRGSLSTVVRVEISLNDEVCETSLESLVPGSSAAIRVCVLEDILAEKLRALLQQPLRNRHRRQDVYDIARLVRCIGDQIDPQKVSEYLVRKARARGIEPRRSSFDEEARRRAAFDYDHLFKDVDPDFIPFDEAWSTVLDFVAQLSLPE